MSLQDEFDTAANAAMRCVRSATALQVNAAGYWHQVRRGTLELDEACNKFSEMFRSLSRLLAGADNALECVRDRLLLANPDSDVTLNRRFYANWHEAAVGQLHIMMRSFLVCLPAEIDCPPEDPLCALDALATWPIENQRAYLEGIAEELRAVKILDYENGQNRVRVEWANAVRLATAEYSDGASIRGDVQHTGGSQQAEGKGYPSKQSWTQPDLDKAIEEYKARRSSNFHQLVECVQRGDKGAKKAAQKIFGRNAIARALGVKASAMVSKSPVWCGIAGALGLREAAAKKKIGLNIAMEERAVAAPVTEVDRVIRRETVGIIRQAFPDTSQGRACAEATIEKLTRGEMTDDQAREMVETLNRS